MERGTNYTVQELTDIVLSSSQESVSSIISSAAALNKIAEMFLTSEDKQIRGKARESLIRFLQNSEEDVRFLAYMALLRGALSYDYENENAHTATALNDFEQDSQNAELVAQACQLLDSILPI